MTMKEKGSDYPTPASALAAAIASARAISSTPGMEGAWLTEASFGRRAVEAREYYFTLRFQVEITNGVRDARERGSWDEAIVRSWERVFQASPALPG